jgi:hypothetical protein
VGSGVVVSALTGLPCAPGAPGVNRMVGGKGCRCFCGRRLWRNAVRQLLAVSADRTQNLRRRPGVASRASLRSCSYSPWAISQPSILSATACHPGSSIMS